MFTGTSKIGDTPQTEFEAEAAARPLRILQIGKFYPPQKGGIESHLHSLCVGLSTTPAVDLRVIAANVGRESRDEEVDGVRLARLGTRLDLAGAPFCPDLYHRLKNSSADIIHVHLPNPTAVLTYLAVNPPGRLVVSYHSDIVRQRVLERLFRPFLQMFLRRADAIVVATPLHVERSRVLSRFREQCVVIPYGVDIGDPLPASDPEVSAIRDKFGSRIVLAVGRLVYYKGFEFLIRAMQWVDATLLLVGQGPMRERLQREARAAGLADRVVFLGAVDDLRPYYAAADVFALPSTARSEFFGIVQLEAMAAGTPVVNTNLDSGVPFVSLHGVTGLTVEPGDAPALAEAIERILRDHQLRSRFGAAAEERVRREFTRGAMLDRMLALYGRLCGTRLSSSQKPAGGRAGVEVSG